MKLIILFLLAQSAIAQPVVSYTAYLPMRTYHFNRDEAQFKKYLNTEGGNIGLIAGRKLQYKEFFIETSAGFFINSFGSGSFMISQGIGITENENFLDLMIAIGATSGYRKLYTEKVHAPEWIKRSGIAPVAIFTLSMHKGIKMFGVRVSPQVILSTMYLNGGIKITQL